MILVTIWMVFAFGSSGDMKQVSDHRSREACEAKMREGMEKGFAVRCMETRQVVSKGYYDSLR